MASISLLTWEEVIGDSFLLFLSVEHFIVLKVLHLQFPEIKEYGAEP